MTEQERIELLKQVAELKALVDKMTPGNLEILGQSLVDSRQARVATITEFYRLTGDEPAVIGSENALDNRRGFAALKNDAIPIIDALTANLHAQGVDVYALAETLIYELREAEADGSTANLRHIFADTIREALKKQEESND